MKVFVLCTCRRPELLPYSLLVFKTIRTGFPSSRIVVRGNSLQGDAAGAVEKAVKATDAEWEDDASMILHHQWIEGLAVRESEPFWICDADVVFYEKVEDWKFDTSLAGWRIPEFQDEFTKAATKPRLHTSLLYVDPAKLKRDIGEYEAQFPKTIFNPLVNLFYPLCLPSKRGGVFYDTCSLLYHAVGGTPFKPAQLDAYFHFNFGCIPDVVLPHLSNAKAMAVARQAVLENPNLGRGMWREQAAYYQANQDVSVMPQLAPQPTTAEQAKEGFELNRAICQDDPEAMAFNNMWYRYCHLIDDLIDTMEDGRPMMSSEQILGIFALAAMLYNSPFFIKHRDLLFPLVLQITNSYADSVAWENSPLYRRRIMADCLRTCGNEMYNMIAMIKGGWEHMRDIGPKIRERDWIRQHDENDRPN